MSIISINYEKCNSCLICMKKCPYDAMEVRDEKVWIKTECISCGICFHACKREAIILPEKTNSISSNDRYSGICLYGEHFNGRLSSVVPELIKCASDLKRDLKVPVSVILLGNNLKKLWEELLSYGVDEVWKIDHEDLDYFKEDVLTKLIVDILQRKRPEIFLGGATVFGRSVFPRVAANLSTGLTADCTALDVDHKTGLLRQTRPTFGGNLMATILCENSRPQMATLRPNVFKPMEKQDSKKGTVEDLSFLPIGKSKFEILDFKEESISVNISDADIIVSGGRGLKNIESFKQLERLASKLGGALGASRAAVDSGWIPYSHQIGQTGKTVNPSLYFAFGISGAIQHVLGMKSSDKIVAVNSDPQAPIFEVSDYGIVGKVEEILPELLLQIED